MKKQVLEPLGSIPWLSNSCYLQNLMVPEQIAILGVGNYEISCQLANVALSSVDTNQILFGYETAKQLDQLMNGINTNKIKYIPPVGIIVGLKSGEVVPDNWAAFTDADGYVKVEINIV